jgi:hypothetical protein
MEKQRCARAAALSGKSLDCPGCNDPNQECNLHHIPGTTVQSSAPSSGGRRVQATKSEAHTTTATGRPGGRNKRIVNHQHRIHENNNQVSRAHNIWSILGQFFTFLFVFLLQFYKTNDRYNPQGSYCSSQQVTSTTGNGDHHGGGHLPPQHGGQHPVHHPQLVQHRMDHARHHRDLQQQPQPPQVRIV